LALGACEAHHAPATRGAPEYLHDALSGDLAAQADLADCYEKASCLGYQGDRAMACAWRGVRLASASPTLTLADSTRFAATCAVNDPSLHQRASIAYADLTSRVFRRDPPQLDQAIADAGSRPVLYPSIEAVRTQLNAELGRMRQRPRLPVFAPARPGADGTTLEWSSCASGVCLSGVTPAYGGGVLRYQVTIQAAVWEGSGPDRLAASLAAAGLQWPSLVQRLTQGDHTPAQLGPACGAIERRANGDVTAVVAAPPCGAADGRD
jgi:hypothetical protein